MKRQGIFLRTVKSRNRGRASERAVCGVFSDFSLAEPASRPAYAPAATSPARYRTGRSKQHHHARNVKPLPPSGESEGHTPRAGGGEGGHLPVPLAFFASFWQKKEESPFPLCSVACISTVYCICSCPILGCCLPALALSLPVSGF